MRTRPSLALFVIALVAVNCAGCGRRGALQPPGSSATEERASVPGPASPRALPQGTSLPSGTAGTDREAVAAGDELPPSATPAAGNDTPIQTSKGAKRGYTIPKGPFILDPIL